MGDITQLIDRARQGDRGALDDLFEAMYPELRRLAHARLSRNERNTMLDTTALVHECYVKYANAGRLQAVDRVHFLAYSAAAMRSIIVDFARAKIAERRGGDAAHLTLDTDVSGGLPSGEHEIVAVHDALLQMEELDPRLVRIVEMRYFVGLSDLEIAEALGVSDRTVRREWEKARLLLAASLRS